jgi:hypothetical protein
VGAGFDDWSGDPVHPFCCHLRKAHRYSLELSEEPIHTGKIQMPWENVVLIAYQKARDNSSSLVLRLELKDKMEVPGVLDGFAYVKAFIENHAGNPPVK